MEAFFVLFVLLIVAAGIIGIVASVKMARKADEAWSRTARALSFQHTAAKMFRRPKMHGSLHGCRVLVETYTRGSGKNSTTYTRFRVNFPLELGVALKLTQQGFFSGLAKAFGAQDIEVGDQAFDDAVVVKGEDRRAVLAFLTPERRRTIRHLLRTYSGIEITDEAIEWSKRGVVRDADLLSSVVEELASAAVLLTGEGETAGAEVAAPPPPLPPLPPEEPKPRPLPAPTALPTPAAPEPDVPLPPARAPEPAAEPEALPPPPTDPEPEPAPAPIEGPLDAAAVCRALFAEGTSTFEAGKRFDAEYRDRLVRGTGTLLATGTFTYDFVLGRDGAKAVLEVYRVPSAWKKEGEPVVAEIGLPAGAASEWASHEGKTLAFWGRLIKVDALMKKFHVLEGELEEV